MVLILVRNPIVYQLGYICSCPYILSILALILSLNFTYTIEYALFRTACSKFLYFS